jgi:DNA-binding MarR family transcriptional regulator
MRSEPPALPAFPVSVPQGMVRLSLTVAAIYAEVSRSLGLTAQQAQLLCAARRRTPIGDLAAFMRCERSGVSHLVERAASRGLVARRGSEDDGRVKVVELSSDGEALVERFLGGLMPRLSAVVADWSTEERESVAQLLNELSAGLDAMSDANPAVVAA